MFKLYQFKNIVHFYLTNSAATARQQAFQLISVSVNGELQFKEVGQVFIVLTLDLGRIEV